MNPQKFVPEDHEKMNREERIQLLESIGVKEVFDEGEMKINRRTCRGVDCRLCIQACPTNALYWKEGEVGIVEELCVYCTSCVNVCMIDSCIHVSRTRSDGKAEKFCSPQEIQKLLRSIGYQKAEERTKSRCAHEWPFLDSILEFSSGIK